MTRLRIGLIGLLLLATSALGWVGARVYLLAQDAPPEGATGLRPAAGPAEVPPGGPFTLVDHAGTPVSDRDYRGTFLLVSFGYTFCPDVCPTTLLNVTGALDLLGDDAGRVRALFISVDPERDTPKILAEYISNFHPHIVGLTGTAAQVRAAAEAYGVRYEKVMVDEDDGTYLMNHSALIDLIDPEGRYLTSFPYTVSAESLASAIRDTIDGKRLQGAGT